MFEFEKSDNKNINIIRYILCIPSGFIAYYLFLGFLYIITYMNDFLIGDNWLAEYIPIFDYNPNFVISLFMGVPAFVYIYYPYHIIPDFKRVLGLVMIIIYSIYFVFISYLSTLDVLKLDYVQILSQFLGVSYGCFIVFNRKNLF